MTREMKDSGVRWIGDIPSNWKVLRTKNLCTISSGTTPKSEVGSYWDGDIKWITPADFKTIDKWVSCGRRNISEIGKAVSHLTAFPKGSIVFSKRAPIGQVSIMLDELCINQGCFGCVANDRVRNVFLYYLLSSFTEQFELLGSGTTFKEISASNFANFKLPLPPLTEQKVIADFLDAKCGEIDGLLADLDAEVKILTEYKKSIIAETVTHGIHQVATKHTGISWIGDIPSSWDLKRLQFCIKEVNVKNNPIQTDFVLSLTIKDGVLPYDEKGDIGNKAKENHADYKLAFPDTIVLNSMNILIGAVGISKYFGCVSPVYYVFKNHEDCDLRYINYVLSSISFQKYLRNYAKGILEIRLRVSAFDILKQKIPVPSLDEQIEIANYLDSKCSAIDQAITDKTQQIETLKAYKSSLIYEYVTGKKQVAI